MWNLRVVIELPLQRCDSFHCQNTTHKHHKSYLIQRLGYYQSSNKAHGAYGTYGLGGVVDDESTTISL